MMSQLQHSHVTRAREEVFGQQGQTELEALHSLLLHAHYLKEKNPTQQKGNFKGNKGHTSFRNSPDTACKHQSFELAPSTCLYHYTLCHLQHCKNGCQWHCWKRRREKQKTVINSQQMPSPSLHSRKRNGHRPNLYVSPPLHEGMHSSISGLCNSKSLNTMHLKANPFETQN